MAHMVGNRRSIGTSYSGEDVSRPFKATEGNYPSRVVNQMTPDTTPERKPGSSAHRPPFALTPTLEDYQKWNRISKEIARMYPTDLPPNRVSPFVPRTFEAYMAHRSEMVLAERQAALERAKRAQAMEGLTIAKIMPAFGGKKFGSPDNRLQNPSNRGAVLAMETIWCPDPDVSWQARAPWPSYSEARWEGDSRVATESGRFLRWHPLPRLPVGWPGWKQDYKENPMVEIYPFDRVWAVPTMEDLYLPVDEVEDSKVVASLLNKNLLDRVEDSTTSD